MAFGRLGNRHDTWLAFCAQYQTQLAEVGLSVVFVKNEERFRDILREGSASALGVTLALAELSAEQWDGLARFATAFFREFESFMPLDLFPAFRQEVERRRK